MVMGEAHPCQQTRVVTEIPKLGWVKLLGYRPLGGELRSVGRRRDRCR